MSTLTFPSKSPFLKIFLNLQRCGEITDEGLYSLGKALKTLLSLKSLHLDLSGCSRLTRLGFQSILKNLKVLTSLKHLHLSFDKFLFFQIWSHFPLSTGQMMQFFWASIKRWKHSNHYKLLSSILTSKNAHRNQRSRPIYSSQEITDTAMEIICKALQASLRHLSLDFSKYNLIVENLMRFRKL